VTRPPRAYRILKFALLRSLTDGWAVQVTRTRALLVGGPVRPRKDPSTTRCSAPRAAITLHVLPLSRLSSSFTDARVPRLCLQSIVWTVPIDQRTHVFGVV
jgi:hypothetical protein